MDGLSNPLIKEPSLGRKSDSTSLVSFREGGPFLSDLKLDEKLGINDREINFYQKLAVIPCSLPSCIPRLA